MNLIGENGMQDVNKLGLVNIENPTIFNEGRKPVCELVAWTPDPINLMYQVWEFAKNDDGLQLHTEQLLPQGVQAFDELRPRIGKVPEGLAEFQFYNEARRPPLPPEEETEFFQRLIKDWTGIPEMVQFTFTFRVIPEALLGQLARHRFGKLFVRSARVFPAGSFAEEGRYFQPDSCSDRVGNPKAALAYNAAMKAAQDAYAALVDAGVPLEDARGVMPMHALYDMTFTMDLKSLTELVQKRSCLILQQQYWAPLLASMRDELCQKVDSRLSYIFTPPCEFRGACISPMEQELRCQGKDPNEPCPIYIERWGADLTEAAQ
jgi:hypothetical protein